MSPTHTLVPRLSSHERIMGFGPAGCGKTDAALSIARACPDAEMIVMDNDTSYAYGRLLETRFADVAEVGNVEVREVSDEWLEFMEELREIVSRPFRQHEGVWLVIDSATPTWPMVQDYYASEVFTMGAADYFLRQRSVFETTKGANNGKASDIDTFDGWKDWGYINKLYTEFYRLLKRWRGHLCLTAEATAVSTEDKGEIKETFGPYGFKPAGQKGLPFKMHTNLLFTKSKKANQPATWLLTTCKDRGREELEGELLQDFATDYLQGVAGWRRMKLEEAT